MGVFRRLTFAVRTFPRPPCDDKIRMKRSEINNAIREASEAFRQHDWFLPPDPQWDVTDFGLGDFSRGGLVCVNLAAEPEYCEKIMYVRKDQVTPVHCHRAKKEDIICRWGRLAVQIVADAPSVVLQVCGKMCEVSTRQPLYLDAGERITLAQCVRHTFWADTDYAIVGEVSTANNDLDDNYFDNPGVGRFSEIEEDEPPVAKLVCDS